MMASYVEPTTNKGSFRFGSQFHLLKDATTTQTKGLIPAVFWGEGVAGEGEQLAQPVGRRWACSCLLCLWQGMGLGHPSSLVALCGKRPFETQQEVPQSTNWS